MCGGTSCKAASTICPTGSSPHMRGALLDDRAVLVYEGIIPHMCGEHRFGTCPQSQPPGSSPHVRGAPKLVDHRPIVGGIIPACAGSTFGTTGVPYCAMGSSPHVRGARHQPVVEAPAHGIIPTCAGSTVGRMNDLMQTQGSSPHVRGALLRKLLRDRPEGIIPACTGSTTRCRTPSSRPWDHPRMCGEHSVPSPGRPPLAGSSPHVRGALVFGNGGVDVDGIIPACTGSTSTPAPRRTTSRDHPRMYGEHASSAPSTTAA